MSATPSAQPSRAIDDNFRQDARLRTWPDLESQRISDVAKRLCACIPLLSIPFVMLRISKFRELPSRCSETFGTEYVFNSDGRTSSTFNRRSTVFE